MTNRELILRLLDFPLGAEVKFLIEGDYNQPDIKSEISDVFEDSKGQIIIE